MVLHRVRARRPDHRARDAVVRSVRRARGAALPCRAPGARARPGGGHGAGQDPARGARMRAGAPRRGAVPALLRLGGLHAALRRARRRRSLLRERRLRADRELARGQEAGRVPPL